MAKGLGTITLVVFGLVNLLRHEANGAPLFNLSAARSFTILQVGDGAVNQQGGVAGNIGLTSTGKLQNSGATVTGDLYLGNNASAQFSGSYNNNRPVTGMTHLGSGSPVGPASYNFTTVSDNPQAVLNQARAEVTNVSSAANMLAATSTLSNIANTMTLSGSGVYYLNSLNLGSNAVLTLNGSANDWFVFNISSAFKLTGAQILLAGGLTLDHVLFNYTGTTDVNISGGSRASQLSGILLALNARVNLSGGLIVGEIITGKDVLIAAGSEVRQTNLVPESGRSVFLLTLGFIAIAALRFGLPRFAPAKL